MLRRDLLRLAGGAALLATTGCGPRSRQSGELRTLQVLLDWKSEPTYAGFYLARERGEYRRRGLDVTIVEGNGATTSAQVLGVGNEYQIGSNSGGATAIARSQGVPVKSVAVYYPEIPTVIYSRADTPIRTPQDLIGRRVGLIAGSITTDEYRGLIAANNLDRSRIREVGAGFDVAPLLSKQVDGLLNYAELTPVELGLQGNEIVTMRLSQFGVHAYSLNLIANDRLIDSDPELVRNVVEATAEGYRFVKEQPAEAAAIFSRLFPEKSAEYVRASMAVVAQQLSSRPGEQTRAGWQATINTLQGLGLLPNPVSVDDVAASAFLAG